MSDRLFEEWRAYQKLLENDYMDHRSFFKRLTLELGARFDHPISLLDLGCGDAQPALAMLKALDVSRYVGVDESATAVGRAKQSLAGTGIACEWVVGDLLESLPQLAGPFDVILASFSIHHLAGTEPKRALFGACRPLLTDEGVMAVIDVFRQPGEAREDYVERWVSFANRHYQALDAQDKNLLFQHARARDFPESLPTYRKLAAEVNLGELKVLMADAWALNHLVLMAPAGH